MVARRYEILVDAEAVAARAEELVRARLASAVADRGRADLVLAGGSTPKRLYERLASHPGDAWSHIHLWFGDERTVGPDHPDSNYGMARRALLGSVPAATVERIHGEAPPAEAAADYERRLVAARPDDPRFDVVLLGMGADGHTASLFPGTPICDERERLVASVWVERLATSRVSLTFRALASTRLVLFLVAGADKAARVAEIFVGGADLPAGRVGQGEGGPETLWLLDAAAAAQLTSATSAPASKPG